MPIDAAGKEHYSAGSGARIVSLAPSLTELLFDLGLDKKLVGRSSSCVEPEGRVDQIVVVGSTKSIDLMKLAELGPSHVLVNLDDEPESVVEEIINLGVEVVITHCKGPDDVVGLFDFLGSLFGREEQSAALTEVLQQEIAATRQVAAERPVRNVVYLTWKNPWISVSRDSYTTNLLALAGLKIMGGGSATRFPQVTIDRELMKQADLVLFGDEPFRFEEEDIQEFQLENNISGTPKLEIIDGRALSWAGKRTVEALRELSQLAARL